MTISSRALFIGPHCENLDQVEDLLSFMLENFREWRKTMNSGLPELTPPVRDAAYEETLKRNREVIRKVCDELHDSCPFFKPTYMGHMASDTLIVSHVARYAAMLRNQNNCSYEASPSTTRMEFAVCDQLCTLFGFNPENGMINFTSGGSLAVIEAYWKLRNLKSFALALAKTEETKSWVEGKDEYELLTSSVSFICDQIERAQNEGVLESVIANTARFDGVQDLGVVVYPASKHYSHVKSQDLLGIGVHSTREVPVHEDYATDMAAYRKIILDLVERKIPILCATCIVGSTENGAFDDTTELAAIRRECEEKFNVSFPILIDGAYGGYCRAMLKSAENKDMTFEEADAHWSPILPNFLTPKVYSALNGMKFADIIVCDPHKLGYIPFGAGAAVYSDCRLLDASTYSAPYAFNDSERDILRRIPGSCALQGSRPGAAVASVYAAHLACPLNVEGYGHLYSETIRVARNLENFLDGLSLTIDGREFKVYTFPGYDFHMVCWVIKEVGEQSMLKNNDLNEYFYSRCSVLGGKFENEKFLDSSTIFTAEEYSEAPWAICEKAGYDRAEWEKVGALYAQRSTCMNPWLKEKKEFDRYTGVMKKYFEDVIAEWVEKTRE